MRRILGIAASLLFAAAAIASSVEALDDAELVKRAKTIAHGKVTLVRVDWNENRTRLWTIVEVAPTEVWKGENVPVLTLKMPGGAKDGMATVVHGMPRFEVGEEVVVFATAAHEKSGACVPVGLGQGKWTVATKEGKRVVQRTLGGARAQAVGGKPVAMDTERGFDDLAAAIKAEVAKQKKEADAKAAGGK